MGGKWDILSNLPPDREEVRRLAREAAVRHGVNPDVIEAQAFQESGFNRNAGSHAGAEGPAQFMPATGAAYGLRSSADRRDPVKSMDAMARHMRDLLKKYDGNVDAALAAYNGGPKHGNIVARGGVSPSKENRDYLPAIKAHYDKIAKRGAYSGAAPSAASSTPPAPASPKRELPADTGWRGGFGPESDMGIAAEESKATGQTAASILGDTPLPGGYDLATTVPKARPAMTPHIPRASEPRRVPTDMISQYGRMLSGVRERFNRSTDDPREHRERDVAAARSSRAVRAGGMGGVFAPRGNARPKFDIGQVAGSELVGSPADRAVEATKPRTTEFGLRARELRPAPLPVGSGRPDWQDQQARYQPTMPEATGPALPRPSSAFDAAAPQRFVAPDAPRSADRRSMAADFGESNPVMAPLAPRPGVGSGMPADLRDRTPEQMYATNRRLAPEGYFDESVFAGGPKESFTERARRVLTTPGNPLTGLLGNVVADATYQPKMIDDATRAGMADREEANWNASTLGQVHNIAANLINPGAAVSTFAIDDQVARMRALPEFDQMMAGSGAGENVLRGLINIPGQMSQGFGQNLIRSKQVLEANPNKPLAGWTEGISRFANAVGQTPGQVGLMQVGGALTGGVAGGPMAAEFAAGAPGLAAYEAVSGRPTGAPVETITEYMGRVARGGAAGLVFPIANRALAPLINPLVRGGEAAIARFAPALEGAAIPSRLGSGVAMGVTSPVSAAAFGDPMPTVPQVLESVATGIATGPEGNRFRGENPTGAIPNPYTQARDQVSASRKALAISRMAPESKITYSDDTGARHIGTIEGSTGGLRPVVTIRSNDGRSEQLTINDLVRRQVEPGANNDVLAANALATAKDAKRLTAQEVAPDIAAGPALLPRGDGPPMEVTVEGYHSTGEDGRQYVRLTGWEQPVPLDMLWHPAEGAASPRPYGTPLPDPTPVSVAPTPDSAPRPTVWIGPDGQRYSSPVDTPTRTPEVAREAVVAAEPLPTDANPAPEAPRPPDLVAPTREAGDSRTYLVRSEDGRHAMVTVKGDVVVRADEVRNPKRSAKYEREPAIGVSADEMNGLVRPEQYSDGAEAARAQFVRDYDLARPLRGGAQEGSTPATESSSSTRSPLEETAQDVGPQPTAVRTLNPESIRLGQEAGRLVPFGEDARYLADAPDVQSRRAGFRIVDTQTGEAMNFRSREEAEAFILPKPVEDLNVSRETTTPVGGVGAAPPTVRPGGEAAPLPSAVPVEESAATSVPASSIIVKKGKRVVAEKLTDAPDAPLHLELDVNKMADSVLDTSDTQLRVAEGVGALVERLGRDGWVPIVRKRSGDGVAVTTFERKGEVLTNAGLAEMGVTKPWDGIDRRTAHVDMDRATWDSLTPEQQWEEKQAEAGRRYEAEQRASDAEADRDRERSLRRTDELTKVGNLVSFKEAVRLYQSFFGGREPTVAMVDQNGLKHFNDYFKSHLFGDDVLIALARAAGNVGLRIHRIGGDEFGIVANMPISELKLRMQAMVEDMRLNEFYGVDPTAGPVILSNLEFTFGVDKGKDAADARLYEAKEAAVGITRPTEPGGRPPSVRQRRVEGDDGVGGNQPGDGVPPSAKKAGANNVEPREGAGAAVRGKSGEISVPGSNERIPFTYVIRDAEDVHASHVGLGEKNPTFEYVNDRRYDKPEDRERIENQARNYDTAQAHTDNPTPEVGPSIIDTRGNVIGGNSREMTTKRVYAYHPENARALRKSLKDRAEQLGIPAEQIAAVDSMKRPQLYREIDPTYFATADVQRLIRDFNNPSTAKLTVGERAMSLARNVSPEALNLISTKIGKHGEDGSVAQALTSDGPEIINKLIADGLITNQERPELFDDNGAVNEKGRSLVRDILIGKMFRDGDQLTTTRPSLKGKLERIASRYQRVENDPALADFHIAGTLHDAIDLLNEAAARGTNRLELVYQQESLLEAPRFSDEAIGLAEVLQDGPVNAAKAINGYYREAIRNLPDTPKDLFGMFPATPKDAAAEFLRRSGEPEEGDSPPLAMAEDLETPAPKHKYGSSQINAPEPVARKIRSMSEAIPDDALAGDGRETDPHVTVLYGLEKPEDVQKIRDLAAKVEPFYVTLGETSLFPPSEYSDGAAVLKVDVESLALRALHQAINDAADIPTKPQSFENYAPHMTIAYVKPERAQEFVGLKNAKGQQIRVEKFVVTDRDGKQTEIVLGGKDSLRMAPEPSKVGDSDASMADYMARVQKKIADREALAAKLAATGKPVKLKHPDGRRIALVGKDVSSPGKFRSTRFDDDGPIGHTTYNTREDALNDIMREGFEPVDSLPEEAGTPTRLVPSTLHGHDLVVSGDKVLDVIPRPKRKEPKGWSEIEAEVEAPPLPDLLKAGQSHKLTVPKGATDAPILYVNHQTADTIQSIQNGKTSTWAGASWLAQAKNSDAHRVADALYDLAGTLPPAQAHRARSLADSLLAANAAALDGVGSFSIIKTERRKPDGTLEQRGMAHVLAIEAHEQHHAVQKKLSLAFSGGRSSTEYIDPDFIDSVPGLEPVIANLQKSEVYEVYHKASMAMEVFTHLSTSPDVSVLGITRRQATELLRHFYDAVYDRHGREGVEAFVRINEEAQGVRDEILSGEDTGKGERADARERERASRGVPSGEGRGDGGVREDGSGDGGQAAAEGNPADPRVRKAQIKANIADLEAKAEAAGEAYHTHRGDIEESNRLLGEYNRAWEAAEKARESAGENQPIWTPEDNENLQKFVEPSTVKTTVFHGGPKIKGDVFNTPTFFAGRRRDAEWFAGESGGKTREFYIQLKNPFDVSTEAGAKEFVKLAERAGVETNFEEDSHGWSFYAPEVGKHSSYEGTNLMDLVYVPAVREQLKLEGYDGLRGSDTLERSEIPAYVVLEPTQIKSATKNRGTFDSNDPNMLHASEDRRGSLGPEADELVKKAVDTFGTTDRLSDTGFLTRDGEGIATFADGKVDHDVALERMGLNLRPDQFQTATGALRIVPGNREIDVTARLPMTREQANWIVEQAASNTMRVEYAHEKAPDDEAYESAEIHPDDSDAKILGKLRKAERAIFGDDHSPLFMAEDSDKPLDAAAAKAKYFGAGRKTAAEPELSSSTPQGKESQTLGGRPPSASHSDRIKPAPLTGGTPKPLNRIIEDLADSIDRVIAKTKQKRRYLGTYWPRDTHIGIRYAGDLDTVAHEAAHAMDDQHGIVAEWAYDEDGSPFDDELIPSFSQHGSRPPGGLDKAERRAYERAEGVAEWVRAYVFNPDAAKAAAPEFARWFDLKVPQETKAALAAYSKDVRQWAGLDADKQVETGMRMEMPQKGWIEKKLGIRKGHVREDIGRELSDQLKPAIDRWKEVTKFGGQDPTKIAPRDNFETLLRRLAGHDEKMEDIFENGFPDMKNPLEIDDKGRVVKVNRILEGGINRVLRHATGREDLKAAASVMASERQIYRTGVEEEKATAAAKELTARFYTKGKGVLDKEASVREKAIEADYNKRLKDIVKSRDKATAKAKNDKERQKAVDLAHRRTDDAVKRYERDRIKHSEWVDKQNDDLLQRVQRFHLKAQTRGQKRAWERASHFSPWGAGVYHPTETARAAIEDMQRRDPALYERAKAIATDARDHFDAGLQYLEDMGRYSPEEIERFRKERDYYTPFNRVLDPDAPEDSRATHGGGVHVTSSSDVVKKFKGGHDQIENPFVSMLDKMYRAVKEADRNAVMNAFVEPMRLDRSMYQGPAINLAQFGFRGQKGDKDAVRIFHPTTDKNGKRTVETEYWVFPKDTLESLKGIGEVGDLGWTWTVLTAPGRLQRWGVVRGIGFMIRNPLRDPFQRVLMSNVGSEFYRSFTRFSPEEKAAFRQGGGQAGHFETAPADYDKMIDLTMAKLASDKKTLAMRAHDLWTAPERIGRFLEEQGRLAEFQKAIEVATKKYGMDSTDALIFATGEARGLLDYAIAGRTVKRISQMIPFTNPQIQGLKKTGELLRKAWNDPAKRKTLIAKIAYSSILPEILAYTVNAAQGEDVEEKYWQQPAYLRDTFWNFHLGDDFWLRVPKPFELGLPASFVGRAISYGRGDPHAFEGHGGQIFKMLAPVDPEVVSTGGLSGIGQAVMNRDIFRNQYIVDPNEEKMHVELRKGTKNASNLGQILQKATGDNIDARTIDFLLRSQLGGVGTQAAQASDIGEPGGAKRLGMTTLGIFTGSPGTAARDVQFVLKEAEARNESNSDVVEDLREIKRAYNEAETAEDRERLSTAMIQAAKKARAQFEETGSFLTSKEGKARERNTKKRVKRDARDRDNLLEDYGILNEDE